MGVLDDGAFQHLDVRRNGDDVVEIGEFHAFEVGAVGVDTVAFESGVVVGVYAEGAQQPFEGRFVGVHVEQDADAVRSYWKEAFLPLRWSRRPAARPSRATRSGRAPPSTYCSQTRHCRSR